MGYIKNAREIESKNPRTSASRAGPHVMGFDFMKEIVGVVEEIYPRTSRNIKYSHHELLTPSILNGDFASTHVLSEYTIWENQRYSYHRKIS